MRKAIFVLTFFTVFAVMAAETEFSGFADTFNAASFKHGDMTASRTRFRGKLNVYYGDTSMFASINAENNGLSDESVIKLHEAYMEMQIRDYNLRVGKQLIIWGNSDGFRLTDMICPLDMTEFVTQDFDDTRIPISAVNISTMKGPVELQIIGIPTFSESEFPLQDSPWHYVPNNMKGMKIQDDKPENKLQDSEAAFKAAFYFSRIDFAVSGLYVWTDSPLHKINGDNLVACFRRQKVIGIESSCTIGKYVLRSENTVHFEEYMEKENYAGFKKKHFLKSLSGLDWYPGEDWNLSGQLYSEVILDYAVDLNKDEIETTITLNVEKKLMNQMLDISAMTYYNINQKDMYNKFLITYDFNDNISAEIGIDVFSGEEGTYSNQSDNSQIRTKLKYSF